MIDRPQPRILEPLDIEKYEKELLEKLKKLHKNYENIEKSDPAFQVIKLLAYQNTLLIDRINRSNVNSLLELTIDPEYFADFPRYKGENDEDYKKRIKLHNQARSPAGTDYHYKANAYNAHKDVKAVEIINGVPRNHLHFYILSHIGNGEPSAEILKMVHGSLSSGKVKNSSDEIFVFKAGIIEIFLQVTIYTENAPKDTDKEVHQEFIDLFEEYRSFGRGIDSSRIYSYLLRNKHVVRAKITKIGVINTIIEKDNTSIIFQNTGDEIIIKPSECLFLKPENMNVKEEILI